ncbi:penicillin binding protein transpeptidase [Bifidobacterium adolescentis]|nr:penicillin binding protein transpeptidase [Bifidobacterium adolescentis]
MAIEPKTGRILAMVSTPSYDPNQLASHDMSQANSNYGVLSQDATNPMLNRATSQLYPPGPRSKRWWPPRLWKPANTSRIRRFRQEQATRFPAPSRN